MRLLYFLVSMIAVPFVLAGDPPSTVNVNWNISYKTSNTTPSLQVVVNPPLRRGSKIHDRVYQALREARFDYVRYVPWLPYPRLAVAELYAPRDGKTSWDFSLIDPMTIDLIEATQGHQAVMNFSTTPQWMWVTEKPVEFPDDPDQPIWNYTQGTEMRDPTGKEIAQYYARLLSWYTRGGFTDELGKRHESGHKFKFDWWEVLNEPDLEHRTSPQTYTKMYDAIVEALRPIAPEMKYVGISVPAPPDPTMFVHSGSPVLPRQLAGQQSEQYFASMVDLYERTARQDGFPANDLAYAFNHFVVNSYMTYHDLHDVEYSKDPRVKKGRDMFDRITIINQKKTLKPTVYQERAVYKQFKATLKANPAVAQMTDLKKQELVELLAITFGVNYKDYIDAVTREDERGIERARQQAKTNLEKFTGVPVERLKINESGLQM